MKALALLALVSLPALAADGFFRPAPLQHQERAPERFAAKDGALPCTMLISYDTPRPNATTIAYIFDDWLRCRDSFTVAIAAAASAAKISVPGEPAIPPVYQCSITVAFDPASAGAPVVTSAGADACASTNKAVLTIAARQVACVFGRGSCAS